MLYKRILLKLSGNVLKGDREAGVDIEAGKKIAKSIKHLVEHGCEVAIVIGAGNIFRGGEYVQTGICRSVADHVGMLATVINGIILKESLLLCGCESRVFSAVNCHNFVENYKYSEALAALNDNNVLIFVGGTGNPYLTTDTAAAVRACEMQVEILLKATDVNGVYDSDPRQNKDVAKKYDRISYAEVLSKGLKVMDGAAVALCKSNNIPIKVFNFNNDDAINLAVSSNSYGTVIN
jgi:uridylate kinase